MEKKTPNTIPAYNPETFHDANELILVGIIHDTQRGILFVQKYSGPFQLPGGKIKNDSYSSKIKDHAAKEIKEIQKFVFQKSGYLLEARPAYALYPFGPKKFKAFLIYPKKIEREIDWYRQREFHYVFVKPEEIEGNRNISAEDKIIILDYLAREKEIKAKPDSPFAGVKDTIK